VAEGLVSQLYSNPKVVSERLGHASIVLTLDTYSHVLPSMQQAATEKLERILYG
jgi:integrase